MTLKEYPEEFGLRAFNGRFRVNNSWIEPNGDAWYIVQIWDSKIERWVDFGRSTQKELDREIRKTYCLG